MVRPSRKLAWDPICSRSLRDEMELSIICFKYIFQLFEIKLVISTTLLPTELNDPRWWSTKITIKNKQFCSQKIVQLFLWMRDSQKGESDIWGKNSQIIPFFFVWPVYIYAVITGQTWDKQSNLFSVDLYFQPNWGWLFREDWVHHPNWGYSSICTKFPKSLGFFPTREGGVREDQQKWKFLDHSIPFLFIPIFSIKANKEELLLAIFYSAPPPKLNDKCYWDCGATRLRSRTSVEAVKCREMISLERETCKSFKFKILDLTLLGQRPKQHFKFEWTTESWFT